MAFVFTPCRVVNNKLSKYYWGVRVTCRLPKLPGSVVAAYKHCFRWIICYVRIVLPTFMLVVVVVTLAALEYQFVSVL
jgi:hypothetical protein